VELEKCREEMVAWALTRWYVDQATLAPPNCRKWTRRMLVFALPHARAGSLGAIVLFRTNQANNSTARLQRDLAESSSQKSWRGL
jgi:hypothetical protein